MERDVMYRIFSGQASESELERVKEWCESSESNQKEFEEENSLYNALLLSDLVSSSRQRKPSPVFVKRSVMAMACIALVVLSFVFSRWIPGTTDTTINTINVPAGQRVNVILADGTDVWLNAGATLTYPSHFSKGRREVYLSGEAYFDVAHNEKSPFRVNTDILDIKVLGTCFNLDANLSRGVFEASLMEGKIEICEKSQEKVILSLKPNQMASIKDGRLFLSNIRNFDKYRWKEGLYCFRNETFFNIVSDLERHYDVRIVLNNTKISDVLLTGKFRTSDGLDYALRILQQSAPFIFERDKDNNIYYIN